jgi:hypothetical protein
MCCSAPGARRAQACRTDNPAAHSAISSRGHKAVVLTTPQQNPLIKLAYEVGLTSEQPPRVKGSSGNVGASPQAARRRRANARYWSQPLSRPIIVRAFRWPWSSLLKMIFSISTRRANARISGMKVTSSWCSRS